ncbi:MAG: winged helix-turn-helix domain-containing protein [Bryobacterales bacterium]
MLGFGPFQVDAHRRELLHSGQQIAVQAKLFDTLVFLLDRRDRVVEKQELLEHIWPNVHVEESSLYQTVSALRKILGCGKNGERHRHDTRPRLPVRGPDCSRRPLRRRTA